VLVRVHISHDLLQAVQLNGGKRFVPVLEKVNM
jgi:hypothetical protein